MVIAWDVDFTKLTDEEIDWICVCFCQNTEKIWSKTPKKYGPKHRKNIIQNTELYSFNSGTLVGW